MPELPNLLRQRLAATDNGETQAHPDADMLTAYMEHSLLPAESKTVVAHLAVCEPCREVVALSQAVMAQPEMQTVLAPASVARWRRLFTPVFGAAAAVAAMAVIAFMVFQLPQKNSQQALNSPTTTGAPTTMNSPASSPVQETQQAKATSAGEQPAPESKAAAPSRQTAAQVNSAGNLSALAKDTQAKLEDSRETRAAKKIVPIAPTAAASAKAPVLMAALPKKDYVNTNLFDSNGPDKIVVDSQGNNLPTAPQPQPGATNTAFNTANSKITIFADLPANAAGKSNVRLLTPTPPQEHVSCTVCKIVQSTAHTLGFHSPVRAPALRAGPLSNSALGGPGMFSGAIEKNQPSEISAAPARADADSLAASSALSAGAMAYRSTGSAAPTWKVASGRLMKSSGPAQWEDAYPVASSTMEFSFVNARGNDVWAGGSHASLIHSRDGGQTWETVKLGDNATGTIVSIIAGAMSVQVKTSDNQTWASTDGGKSWVLRE